MENPHVANNARILAAEKSERQASTGAPADGRLNALEARLNRIEAALSDTVRWDEQLGKFVAQCLKEAGVQNISARIDALEARPGIKYLGTFREGRVYDEGSLTTFDGSVWHANQRTTTPPGKWRGGVDVVRQARRARPRWNGFHEMSNLPVRSISLRGLSKAEANAKAQKFIDEIYAESIARFETSLRNRGYTSREIADAIATWREIEREQRGASH